MEVRASPVLQLLLSSHRHSVVTASLKLCELTTDCVIPPACCEVSDSLCPCINAAVLALIHAGVSMKDFVSACSAGFLEKTPLLGTRCVPCDMIGCYTWLFLVNCFPLHHENVVVERLVVTDVST